jgi:hypothetical protein
VVAEYPQEGIDTIEGLAKQVLLFFGHNQRVDMVCGLTVGGQRFQLPL